MARPVNADAQATQAKILGTAYDLFASHGIDGASIRDIARGAGVSLAMVHHYFGSKQGLYQACVQAMLNELSGLNAELEGLLASGSRDLAGSCAEAVRVGFRYARAHNTAVRLFQRSLVDTGELDIRMRDENVIPLLDTFTVILGGLLSRPPATLRLPLQSIMFLVVRYAITSERELTHVIGEAAKNHKPRKEASAVLVAIEEHLVDATLRLLSIPRAEPTG